MSKKGIYIPVIIVLVGLSIFMGIGQYFIVITMGLLGGIATEILPVLIKSFFLGTFIHFIDQKIRGRYSENQKPTFNPLKIFLTGFVVYVGVSWVLSIV